MIELTDITIPNSDAIITARNKVYRLLLDLGIRLPTVIRTSIYVSEVLRKLLVEKTAPQLRFSFTKHLGFYHIHIFISCSPDLYEKIKALGTFRNTALFRKNETDTFLDLCLKITDKEFIPNEEFLQNEKERLIQQSTGEMVQEIRYKNLELTKAIEDLKNSSRMIQTEKMRALGSMTAGVAHELNNPMMGILNFIQYAIKHTEEDDRKYRPLVDAEREVKRCQEIITNLLTFSRMKAEGEETLAKIKPSVLFERTEKLQAYKIRSLDIKIIKHFPEEEPEIKLKVNNIQQVVLNLVTNAMDAMKGCEKESLASLLKPLRSV